MDTAAIKTEDKEGFSASLKTKEEDLRFSKQAIGARCPDCGGVLFREGRCPFCPNCGWSRC